MSYPVPPPSYPANSNSKPAYGSTESSSPAGAAEPLLASGSHAPRNDWASEAEDRDVPDDFKIGVTAGQSSADVRAAFVRKVYGVLFCQILGTTVVGALMSTEAVSSWVQFHPGYMMIPMFGAIAAMFGVYWKRYSHPLNLILLGLFTLLESITIGSVVGFYNQTIVLQALVITSFVFVGLTLFTFQSKYDFSSMGTYLFAGLLVFFLTGIVSLFFPFSRLADGLMAGAGCLLFSAYIVYDTHQLINRLHVDDWVLACVSLYLDVLNLFLQILRLLNDIQDR